MSTPRYEASGRKEVTEAVMIAALSALATGIINWGIQQAKAAAKKRAESEKSKVDADAHAAEEH